MHDEVRTRTPSAGVLNSERAVQEKHQGGEWQRLEVRIGSPKRTALLCLVGGKDYNQVTIALSLYSTRCAREIENGC
jgi:hypothetical protein